MNHIFLYLIFLSLTFSAFAESPGKRPDKPKTVDANVVNTIPFSSLVSNPGCSSSDGNCGVGGWPPGRLHAVNLSLVSTRGNDCFSLLYLKVSVDGTDTERMLAQVHSAGADGVTVSQSYATPIEVLFDEASNSAGMRIFTQGGVGCFGGFTATYEESQR